MRRVVATTATLALLALSACGGGDDDGASTGTGSGLPDCTNGQFEGTPERIKRADAEGGMKLDNGLVILPGEECSLDGERVAVEPAP